MIQAVIFDMDGVLIESEAMWQQAEEETFASVGVTVTKELAQLTSSLTTKAVTDFWYSRSPWQGKSHEQVEREVINKVEQLIISSGQSKQGVTELLQLLTKHKIRIGLSTNSPSQLTNAVLNKLDIAHFFSAVTSSDQVSKGKPDPEVYLTTAQKLGVNPQQCLVFEDSITGLTAAVAAEMKVIALPPKYNFDDKRYEPAIEKLNSLSEINEPRLLTLIDSL